MAGGPASPDQPLLGQGPGGLSCLDNTLTVNGKCSPLWAPTTATSHATVRCCVFLPIGSTEVARLILRLHLQRGHSVTVSFTLELRAFFGVATNSHYPFNSSDSSAEPRRELLQGTNPDPFVPSLPVS